MSPRDNPINIFHILVVDDFEDMLFLIQESLFANFHCAITVAKCGKDAIQVLKSENNFSLIICDFQMPFGDGLSVFEFSQTMQDPLPFILYTASENAYGFEGTNFLGKITKGNFEQMIDLIKNKVCKSVA